MSHRASVRTTAVLCPVSPLTAAGFIDGSLDSFHFCLLQVGVRVLLEPEILEKMVCVIVDAADPEQIILFGSRATGDSREDSDVDLLIVESQPFDRNRSRRKEMARLWRLPAPIPVAKDILLYSRDEVGYWKKSLNNAVARALRTGRILYERSLASRIIVRDASVIQGHHT